MAPVVVLTGGNVAPGTVEMDVQGIGYGAGGLGQRLLEDILTFIGHVENGYSQRFAFRVDLLLSPGKAGDTLFACFFYYIAKVLKLNDESK